MKFLRQFIFDKNENNKEVDLQARISENLNLLRFII